MLPLRSGCGGDEKEKELTVSAASTIASVKRVFALPLVQNETGDYGGFKTAPFQFSTTNPWKREVVGSIEV